MSGLFVSPRITLAEWELVESFIQASGPGGQNVNKVATAVQLRFDVKRSPSLPDGVRNRLMRKASHLISSDGVLLLTAREHRTQGRNREAARERLATLIRAVEAAPKPRRKTKPTLASKRRRLDAKKQRGAIKKERGRPELD